jgi:peptide-methionine (S)-S-oxide reductase
MRLVLRLIALGIGITIAATPVVAKDLQTAVFAGGCFWCVEYDMDKVKGVVKTTSGFTGGKVKNPTYKQVTRGGTGHREAVQVIYDADIVSYDDLLYHFWRTIDPTDGGGQFCDRGKAYSPAVYTTTAKQAKIAKAQAAEVKKILGKNAAPVLKAGAFYAADSYHQDYYKQSKTILTRFGPLSKAKAYKRYRAGCGRDKGVKQVWGGQAYLMN